MRPNPSGRLRASTVAACVVAASLAIPSAGLAPATATPTSPPGTPAASRTADATGDTTDGRFPGFPGWPDAPTTSDGAAKHGTPGKPGKPGKPGTAPTLTPKDGAHLSGTTRVAAAPTTAGDPVGRITVDGADLPGAAATAGTSALTFDVGSNSADVAFGNYLVVNGHRVAQERTWVSERVEVPVPDEWLVQGANTVEIHAGGIDSSCGVNFDDFVVSEVQLELLGETAVDTGDAFTYSMGDGSCGSNTSYVKEATVTFEVAGVPGATTGLAADVDTTALANGAHEIVATTRSGASTTHTVRVNNSPVGAPALSPEDGTLTRGVQTVTASAAADGEGGTASLTVDGEPAAGPPTLGDGVSVFSFDVGTNSIETRYQNHLVVNGTQLDLRGPGGRDLVSERVQVGVPNRLLHPGRNTIVLVAGDVSSSCGANLDDFTASDLALSVADGTVTPPADLQATYAMGDGSCGSSTSALPKVELDWTIDAAGETAFPALGHGEATVSFAVGSNSLDGSASNLLRINGVERRIDQTIVGGRGEITFPNEWLLPGWNEVDVVTGAFGNDCNLDDFTISDVVLTPASGTAQQQNAAASYALGDGTCGSNLNSFRQVDLHFLVDAPARGLRADVDTADLEDGEHELAATSTTGERATRVLETDNTAPKVASSTPAAGAKLTSTVPLAVELTDPRGVVGDPQVTLDGEAVALGAPVGPGLPAGEHTLRVATSDSLGNSATREITFTSAGVPDVPSDLAPATGTTGAGTSVQLSARVAGPDGGKVTASFAQADVLLPGEVRQGTADAVPTELNPRGATKASAKGLAAGDGKTLASPQADDVAYQRFDVRVKTAEEHPVVRWSGTADPAREVSLLVWDVKAKAWDTIAASRGQAEGDTVLVAPAGPEHRDRGVVHVMVAATDPFADDLDAGPEGFADPADYDFSIAHMTDTQYLSEGAVEPETAEERAVWESAYAGVTDWIAENADERKIAFVSHTGDLIENNIREPKDDATRDEVTGEFEVSSRLQATIDGIPNSAVAGNHDNWSGAAGGADSYNRYFGPDRYQAAAESWENAEYGSWREGDNSNHYVLFSAGGLDFVAVGMGYGVTREEAEWADGIFERYADRNGILMTHAYLEASTQEDGRDAGFAAPDGSPLYKYVVQPNDNVFLVLAGHVHGVTTNVKPQVGQIADGVVELLADYQAFTVPAQRVGLAGIGGHDPAERLRFGASYFRLLQFDVDRAEMNVDTYSPFLDDFGADEWDPDARYDSTADNMVLPVDLTTRTTSFVTDSLAVYAPTRVIGRETVASGEVAAVRWDRLKKDTQYAWIVTATTRGGGVTAAEPAILTTGGGKR
ncbi:metallophosphoesterase [Isoptericola sp. NPDC057653]|uniref:metallophosphoesterase n=1 Tax=Isoptericola sp. NPDC057653 TaxID=3346195 RepID=UPI0036AA78AE